LFFVAKSCKLISRFPRVPAGVAQSLRDHDRGGTAMQRSILGLAIVLLCSGSAFSQQAQRPTALREIIPGHYAFSSGTFNSGLIVTSEGVVVLDALNSESVGKAEREVIA